jgi:spore coat protein U-like protein
MEWGALHRPRLDGRGTPHGRAAGGLLAAALLAPLPALAQAQGDDATGRTQVSIQEPGSIANVADLDFGKIIQNSSPGTVVLAPGLNATCTTTGGLVRSGVCRAAEFSIFGRRNWKARLRDTNLGGVTLNGPGGATMTMTDITMASVFLTPSAGANGWNLGRYNIDSNNGVATFWLGGTLHVGAAQAPGVYNGTVVVQIQFN